MKAYGYVRVSTEEQAESGLGLESQRQRIQAYAQMRGLELVDVIADEGVSGGKPIADREGGSRLLKALKGCKGAAVVIVLKLDRAFRNAGDCLATVEAWDRKGIALHILDLGGNAVDTASAAGKFMLTVLAGAAEMERNLTRERTKAALHVKRSRGLRISGRIPFGFELAADGVSLTPNAAEQAVIAEMKVLREAGWTLREIASELTSRGIATKGGGTSWAFTAVAGILGRTAA